MLHVPHGVGTAAASVGRERARSTRPRASSRGDRELMRPGRLRRRRDQNRLFGAGRRRFLEQPRRDMPDDRSADGLHPANTSREQSGRARGSVRPGTLSAARQCIDEMVACRPAGRTPRRAVAAPRSARRRKQRRAGMARARDRTPDRVAHRGRARDQSSSLNPGCPRFSLERARRSAGSDRRGRRLQGGAALAADPRARRREVTATVRRRVARRAAPTPVPACRATQRRAPPREPCSDREDATAPPTSSVINRGSQVGRPPG